MAGKHRKRSRRAKQITALSAATVTATALTVGATPLPDKAQDRKMVGADVDLAAAINPFPQPADIPDITGGLGSVGYDLGQTAADVLIRAIVDNLNLGALAAAAGLDPESVIDGLLGGLLDGLPGPLLQNILDEIPIDTGQLVSELLGPIGELTLGPVLDSALQLLGADSLGGLLRLVGIDLSDPLNLSSLDVPGVNILTAGPAFTLLKLLGLDVGWTPALPNSVANDIINSEYLDVSTRGLVQDVVDLLPDGGLGGTLKGILSAAVNTLPNVEVLDLRVPVTIGAGLGAFAIATGYDKVVADLPNQPGGTQSSSHPLLGSFTVLPMVLLFNPARPNGGPLARAYPLFGLLGIDTVNPDTEVTSDGGLPILQTGLSLGGANLVPILLDIGLEFHPSSDVAAWPNPVSLANNLAALLLPTYVLRGIDASRVDEQVTTQVGDILADILAGEPLGLNIYLTLPASTLPLLEPFYLASDVLNLATLGALPVNPFNLVANAFAPVLTSLTNLGYTDVVFNEETGAYERTLTEAGEAVPFMSFPDINWGQVPAVLFNQLLQGIQKEFFSGNPTPGTPNAITGLLDLLTGLGGLGDILGGLGLEDLLGGLVGDLSSATQTEEMTMPAGAADIPDLGARSLMMSTFSDESGKPSDTGKIDDSKPVEGGTNQNNLDDNDLDDNDLDDGDIGDIDLDDVDGDDGDLGGGDLGDANLDGDDDFDDLDIDLDGDDLDADDGTTDETTPTTGGGNSTGVTAPSNIKPDNDSPSDSPDGPVSGGSVTGSAGGEGSAAA
ncbi:hypothetical protein [Mycolicibacterium sp. XJ1819]